MKDNAANIMSRHKAELRKDGREMKSPCLKCEYGYIEISCGFSDYYDSSYFKIQFTCLHVANFKQSVNLTNSISLKEWRKDKKILKILPNRCVHILMKKEQEATDEQPTGTKKG